MGSRLVFRGPGPPPSGEDKGVRGTWLPLWLFPQALLLAEMGFWCPPPPHNQHHSPSHSLPPQEQPGGQPAATALVEVRWRRPTVQGREEHTFNSHLPQGCVLSHRDKVSVGGRHSWEWGLTPL